MSFYAGPMDPDPEDASVCPSCGETHHNPDSLYCTGTCQRAHEKYLAKREENLKKWGLLPQGVNIEIKRRVA